MENVPYTMSFELKWWSRRTLYWSQSLIVLGKPTVLKVGKLGEFGVTATLGFGWYVRHIVSYNVMYGSVGASIALLVWMYLMAAISILGCEFNAEYERLMSVEDIPD